MVWTRSATIWLIWRAWSKEESEDDEDDEGLLAKTTCPNCEEEIYFDDSVSEEGEVICPNCGAKSWSLT